MVKDTNQTDVSQTVDTRKEESRTKGKNTQDSLVFDKESLFEGR